MLYVAGATLCTVVSWVGAECVSEGGATGLVEVDGVVVEVVGGDQSWEPGGENNSLAPSGKGKGSGEQKEERREEVQGNVDGPDRC